MAPFFMLQNMWSFIANVASIFGVLGVSLTNFASDSAKAHIALAILTAAVLFTTAMAAWTLLKWQRRIYPRGYVPISTFVRYTTTDGKFITYETFRVLQIKRAYLKRITQNFSWSGSNAPTIKSSIQKVGAVVRNQTTQTDVVPLEFPSARYYNETEVVHSLMQLDDSDEKSSTHISMTVHAPIRLVHMRVELLHCNKAQHVNMVARLERQLMTAPKSSYELLYPVNFNAVSKSFEHVLTDPEEGYTYRLAWDRPPSPRNKPKKTP